MRLHPSCTRAYLNGEATCPDCDAVLDEFYADPANLRPRSASRARSERLAARAAQQPLFDTTTLPVAIATTNEKGN